MNDIRDDGREGGAMSRAAPLSVQEWLDPQRRAACFDDMLAALKAAEKAIDDCLNFRSHLNYDARDLVRAAIAKAGGASPKHTPKKD